MPDKHEQTNQTQVYHTQVARTTQPQAPAPIAQVPNQLMPLIDVDGTLHHPIAEAADEITDLINDLILSPRLTSDNRRDLRTILAYTKSIITELRSLAAHNHFHNDTPTTFRKGAK